MKKKEIIFYESNSFPSPGPELPQTLQVAASIPRKNTNPELKKETLGAVARQLKYGRLDLSLFFLLAFLDS